MITRRSLFKNSAIAAASAALTSYPTPLNANQKGILYSIELTLISIRDTRANANGSLDKFLKEIDEVYADKIIKSFNDIIALNNLNKNYLLPIQLIIRDFPLETYDYIEYRGLLKKCDWIGVAKIALTICKDIQNEYSLNIVYPRIANKIGLSYRMMDNYEQAIYYYNEAFKYATEDEEKADILTNFCDIYRLKLETDKALNYGKQALKYAANIPQKKAKALEYLGLLEHLNKDFNTSINYLNQAVNIRREINDPRLPLTLSFLALSLIARHNTDDLKLAVQYIQEMKQTETDTGNRLANLYNLEGSAFLALNNYSKAIKAFSLCFDTYKETNYDRGKVIAKSKIIEAYVLAKNFEEAVFTAKYIMKNKHFLKDADFFVLNLARSFFTLYKEIKEHSPTLFSLIDEKTLLEYTFELTDLEQNEEIKSQLLTSIRSS